MAAGGAQLQLGAEPDLFFDGRSCYGQSPPTTSSAPA